MKILDCTLRDGGFKNDFNWDLAFAKRYYELMSDLKFSYIELGYWKQTAKSRNPFYNLNEKITDSITVKKPISNCCVIIDYHYCSKNLKDYPKKGDLPISMIRVTSRKEDLDDSLVFVKKLKDYTDLDISFQIINATNYSKKELNDIVNKLCQINFSFIYFADSHGNLNLQTENWKFSDAINLIKTNGLKTGFHLHNHTNRALLNYYKCADINIDITDTSILGLGKGGGNLKLEDVIINENLLLLLNFIKQEKNHFDFNNIEYLYNIISGRLNITCNYAKQAFEMDLDLEKFYSKCKLLRGNEKDIFHKKFLKK